MSNNLLSELATSMIATMTDEMKERVLQTIFREEREREEQRNRADKKLPVGCYAEGPGYYIAEDIASLTTYNHYVIARNGSTYDGNYVKHRHTIEKKRETRGVRKESNLVKDRPEFKRYECCIHVCFYEDRMKNDYTWFDVTDPNDYVGYMDMKKWTKRNAIATVSDGVNSKDVSINVYAFNGEEKGIARKLQYAAVIFCKEYADFDIDNLTVIFDNVSYSVDEKLNVIM